MTIKQQGGVFGRHPEFSTLSVSGDVFSVSATGAQVNGLLRVNSGVNDLPFLVQSTDATAYIGFKDNTTTDDMAVIIGASGDNLNALAKGRFRLYNNSQQSVQVEATGDFNVMRGNLVIGTSGKGIDFSATAGTGTSELFSDYEEGTFTPVAGASLNILGTWAVAGGVYTKVGRLVNFSARFTGTGIGFSTLNSSYYQFTGLPFAPAEEYTGAWSSAAIAASVSGLVSIVPGSSAFWLNAAQGTTGTSAIYASGTYYTNA